VIGIITPELPIAIRPGRSRRRSLANASSQRLVVPGCAPRWPSCWRLRMPARASTCRRQRPGGRRRDCQRPGGRRDQLHGVRRDRPALAAGSRRMKRSSRDGAEPADRSRRRDSTTRRVRGPGAFYSTATLVRRRARDRHAGIYGRFATPSSRGRRRGVGDALDETTRSACRRRGQLRPTSTTSRSARRRCRLCRRRAQPGRRRFYIQPTVFETCTPDAHRARGDLRPWCRSCAPGLRRALATPTTRRSPSGGFARPRSCTLAIRDLTLAGRVSCRKRRRWQGPRAMTARRRRAGQAGEQVAVPALMTLEP